MNPRRLDYPAMLQDAVRGVVRAALEEVAELGMPGEHHFFIHFRTAHPDASVPAFLRDRYPDEMSIILQHQFWGLMVDEESFSVTLAFDGARYTVTVPFAAVTAFADPAANLALQLGPGNAGAGAQEEDSAEKTHWSGGKIEPASEDSTSEDSGSSDHVGGEVVDLDSFRKR